ncbi:MAG: dihydropteroate synthase [Spirochaeta sp. LUC14_002_19_P3]|nr:MAG: dihydropteroate synthase [Spirochaeta sp. LUC14_002_19_P3]
MGNFQAPRIMGIINCTPDSFYAGSRFSAEEAIVECAEKMIAEGADIIDIGGESTRPGAAAVSAGEQIARTVPAIRAIREISSIPISIDTQSAAVAEAALNAGAGIINDISALRTDARMLKLAAERGVLVVLMHIQGTPETMQKNPRYNNVVAEVRDYLRKAADMALAGGVREEHIILDPGIGFGKRPMDNVMLLKNLSSLRTGNFPLLVGLSRKSFLGVILDGSNEAQSGKAVSRMPDERLVGTIAAHAWCLTQGVDILRVHDVKEARDLIAVWEAFECPS